MTASGPECEPRASAASKAARGSPHGRTRGTASDSGATPRSHKGRGIASWPRARAPGDRPTPRTRAPSGAAMGPTCPSANQRTAPQAPLRPATQRPPESSARLLRSGPRRWQPWRRGLRARRCLGPARTALRPPNPGQTEPCSAASRRHATRAPVRPRLARAQKRSPSPDGAGRCARDGSPAPGTSRRRRRREAGRDAGSLRSRPSWAGRESAAPARHRGLGTRAARTRRRRGPGLQKRTTLVSGPAQRSQRRDPDGRWHPPPEATEM
mmetsp:Transcript_46693/g.149971  ORF Transcript_46693/g.149971 Transcript_46693/m.149971 type:complete len:268 (-) Transcript_46693:1503-2306(-)